MSEKRVSSSINIGDHPESGFSNDFLNTVGMTGPVKVGSHLNLAKEPSASGRQIHHCDWRLMRGERRVDQFDTVQKLNAPLIRLRLISSRIRHVGTAERGFEPTRSARKLRLSHHLEFKLTCHDPRVSERTAIRVGKEITLENASPIARCNDAAGRESYRTEVVEYPLVCHDQQLPDEPDLVKVAS